MCSSPNLGLCRVESSMRVPVPSELCVFTSTYSIKFHEPVTKCSIHSKVKQHQNVEVWSRERFTEGPCNETDVWCPPPPNPLKHPESFQQSHRSSRPQPRGGELSSNTQSGSSHKCLGLAEEADVSWRYPQGQVSRPCPAVIPEEVRCLRPSQSSGFSFNLERIICIGSIGIHVVAKGH